MKTNSIKHQAWHRHIDNWSSSGLTQASYCREHDLKLHQFTYWRAKLFRGNTQEQSKGAPHKAKHGFVPVATHSSPEASLSIQLPNGTRLEGISSATLQLSRQLLEVLK